MKAIHSTIQTSHLVKKRINRLRKSRNNILLYIKFCFSFYHSYQEERLIHTHSYVKWLWTSERSMSNSHFGNYKNKVLKSSEKQIFWSTDKLSPWQTTWLYQVCGKYSTYQNCTKVFWKGVLKQQPVVYVGLYWAKITNIWGFRKIVLAWQMVKPCRHMKLQKEEHVKEAIQKWRFPDWALTRSNHIYNNQNSKQPTVTRYIPHFIGIHVNITPKMLKQIKSPSLITDKLS